MFKFKFIIKNIFYFSFLMFLFILSIFCLDTMANINDVFFCIIGLAMFILIIAILYMINFNFPNPLCTYEIEAKVIKNDSIYFEGSDTSPYDLENNYNSLITIEYLYRNRKYKKSIMLPSHSKVTFNKDKVKIKICKFFPKMVNVI